MNDDEESPEDKSLRELEDTYTTTASGELVVRRYSDGTPVIFPEQTTRQDRIDAMRERVKQRMSLREETSTYTEPVYDDVYWQGVAWLDRDDESSTESDEGRETTQRYRATPTWWDNGRNTDGSPAVRKVWTIEGPEPFDGLTAVDEAQALALADLLNNESKGDHPSRCEQEPGDPT